MQHPVLQPPKSFSLNSVYDLRLQIVWLINNEMLLARREALKMLLMLISTGKFTDVAGDCNSTLLGNPGLALLDPEEVGAALLRNVGNTFAVNVA